MLVRRLTGARPKTRLPAGVVDTQIHLYLDGYPAVRGGPPLPAGLPGPAEYRQVMNWLGIERVVVTQGNAHQLDNSCLLGALNEMGPVARGVAAIAPDTSDAEMRRLSDGGIVGARIMDLPGGAVGLEGLAGVDARADAFGWLLAVQFDGSHILEHEAKLAALKSRYIIDHHAKFLSAPAGPAQVDALKRLIDRGNCWFKFAGCYESSKSGGPDFEDVARVAREIAAHAPERILWGTNWPHNMVSRTEDYPDDAALLDTVLGWIPTEAGLRKALVDNPVALYGF